MAESEADVDTVTVWLKMVAVQFVADDVAVTL